MRVRAQTFALLFLLALLLFSFTGCGHKTYRGGTPYSDTLCAAGVDAYGNGATDQICTGGLTHGDN